MCEAFPALGGKAEAQVPQGIQLIFPPPCGHGLPDVRQEGPVDGAPVDEAPVGDLGTDEDGPAFDEAGASASGFRVRLTSLSSRA